MVKKGHGFERCQVGDKLLALEMIQSAVRAIVAGFKSYVFACFPSKCDVLIVCSFLYIYSLQ